jgi:phenylacetic acid degradation operon negative regulatory protein
VGVAQFGGKTCQGKGGGDSGHQ